MGVLTSGPISGGWGHISGKIFLIQMYEFWVACD